MHPSRPIRFEFRAVPHVFVNAQYYDSQGKKSWGHAFHILGKLDGQPYFTQGRPDKDGRIRCMVPHGLEDANINLMTNEHHVLRYRMSKDEELQPDDIRIELGRIEADIQEMEIVRYKAPILLVKAVDLENQSLSGVRVSVAYPWGKQRYRLKNGAKSDVSFEWQQDGRCRSGQLLPDEDFTLTVSAEGYEEATREITLSEGEEKEVVIVLRKPQA